MSEERKEKFTFGLIPRIIIAIVAGIIIGQLPFTPEWFIQLLVTISSIFSSFLNFVIPLMIVGLIVKGISDLAEGAGKLLGITVGISYGSTLLAGTIAYLVAAGLFPRFITADLVESVAETGEGVEPFFTIPLEPMFDVTIAIIFAFMMGLGISWLRGQHPEEGNILYQFFSGFEKIIMKVLELLNNSYL